MSSSLQTAAPRHRRAFGASLFPLLLGVGWSLGVVPLAAPGVVASRFDTPAAYALIWLAALAYALLGAFALSDSAASNEGRGYYAIVRGGLGDHLGFATAWGEWAAICGATAAGALLTGEYALGLLPAARAGEVLALATIASITLLVWSGRRAAAGLQVVLGMLAIGAILTFAGAAALLGSRSVAEGTMLAAERDGSLFVAVVLAAQAAVVALSGWFAPAYAQGGAGGGRRMGRSMAAAALAAAALYGLMAFATLRVISLPTLAGSDMALDTAAERLLGAASYDAVRALLILVLLASVSAGILMAPRVLEALASDRLFWRGAAERSGNGHVSEVALLISSAFMAAVVITGTLRSAVGAFAVLILAAQLLAFGAVAARPGVAAKRGAAAIVGLAAAAMLGTIVVARPGQGLALLIMVATLPLAAAVLRARRKREALAPAGAGHVSDRPNR